MWISIAIKLIIFQIADAPADEQRTSSREITPEKDGSNAGIRDVLEIVQSLKVCFTCNMVRYTPKL